MTQSNSANGAVLSPSPAQSEAWSGAFVDLLNPQPDTIELEDIARGLANTCRYGGQIRRFYSVAEHAVLVHDLVAYLQQPSAQLLGALFHDAPEAYLHDITSPAKWAMREELASGGDHDLVFCPYDTLTERMEKAIATRFDLDQATFNSHAVKLADMWALRIEARTLTRSAGQQWCWPGELPNDGHLPNDVVWMCGLDPARAEDLWLQRVRSYEQTDIVIAPTCPDCDGTGLNPADPCEPCPNHQRFHG